MNTQQIDERMKAIMIMFKLSRKRLPKELASFIYSSLTLAYLDGKTEAQGANIQSIDGLSGEEEFLAIRELNN